MAEVKMPSNYDPGKDAKETKKAKVKDLTMKQKLRKAFIADEVADVKTYAIFDVVIPSIKKVIRELVMNAIDMAFYGKPQARSRDDRGGAYYDYSRRDRDRDIPDRRSQQSKAQQFVGVRDLDRVAFDDKEDAINTLSYLMDNIEEFGVATVSDFLASAGLTTNPIHQKWGWYDLQGCSVRETPDGDWMVDLPRPKPI